MLFLLSQQNENGIQAQEIWQLSQYLQVNVKQYIMFDQCVLIICHSWVDKWNFHAKKKVTCLVVILMIKFNFSLPLFFVWQDALYREQMLENKLANLQRLISDSKGAVEDNTQVVAYGIGLFLKDVLMAMPFMYTVPWSLKLHGHVSLIFSFSVICSRGQIAVKIRDFGKPAGNFNKGKVWSTMCSQETFEVWTLMVKVRIFQVSLSSMWTQEN